MTLKEQLATAATRLVKFREALEYCCELSGADLSDGFPPDPPLEVFAVRCVQTLRDDYDDACRELWDTDF